LCCARGRARSMTSLLPSQILATQLSPNHKLLISWVLTHHRKSEAGSLVCTCRSLGVIILARGWYTESIFDHPTQSINIITNLNIVRFKFSTFIYLSLMYCCHGMIRRWSIVDPHFRSTCDPLLINDPSHSSRLHLHTRAQVLPDFEMLELSSVIVFLNTMHSQQNEFLASLPYWLIWNQRTTGWNFVGLFVFYLLSKNMPTLRSIGLSRWWVLDDLLCCWFIFVWILNLISVDL